MEIISLIFDFFLHLDIHLERLVISYGSLVYLLVLIIVFMETGCVLTPFLPGDSLLFVLGAIAASGILNIHFLVALLIIAAIFGDTVNYAFGNYLGPKIFTNRESKIFDPSYLEKTHLFFDRHGGKAVVLARFIPILRTYAPFVAGCGSMAYQYFIFYNIFGAVLWVCLFGYGGYLFGNIPFVKTNISIFIIGIVFLSVSPAILHAIKVKYRKTSE